MTNLNYLQGPPFIDDGEDDHFELPNIYPKNGDLFVRVDFAFGKSVFNQSVFNGMMFNG